MWIRSKKILEILTLNSHHAHYWRAWYKQEMFVRKQILGNMNISLYLSRNLSKLCILERDWAISQVLQRPLQWLLYSRRQNVQRNPSYRRVSHLPRNGWFALTFWRIAQCTQRRQTTLSSFDISRIWKVSCQLWENKVWYLGIRDILYPSKAKLKRKKIHHRIGLHRDNNQEPRECKRKEPPRIFTTEF